MTTYCNRCGAELSEEEEWNGECGNCGHYLEPDEEDAGIDWPAAPTADTHTPPEAPAARDDASEGA